MRIPLSKVYEDARSVLREGLNRRFVFNIALILVLVAGTTYARLALRPYIGDQIGLFIFFYAVIAVVSWTGGLLIGVAASVVSTVAIAIFFLMPMHLDATATWWDSLILALFFAVSVTMSWLGEVRLRYVRFLERVERQRNEFVNIAGHELRNPLATMRLDVELLTRTHDVPDAERKRLFVELDQNLAHMQHLIGDLLDNVQIQRGAFVYRDELFSLGSVVRGVVKNEAVLSGYEITVEGNAADVYADKEKIRQVCTNIISNAIKYSPTNKTISVSMREDGVRAHVVVRDRGIGIAPGQLKRVFEPFFRAEDVRARKEYAGLGLGLHLSKLIMRHYGGDITLESVLGEGTTATITLPLAPN